MMNKQFNRLGAVFLFYCLILITSQDVVAAAISLDQAAVVVDVAEPSYIHHGVDELRRQIKEATGVAPVLFYNLQDALETEQVEEMGALLKIGPLVVVGRSMADRLAQLQEGMAHITDAEPGEQGFVLKTTRLAGGENLVLATGSESHGTNYALMQLRQLIAESPSGLSVSSSLDILEKPRLKVRGMFIHKHWRFNYPYCAWTWSVEEWKQTIDMLAFMRYNVVMTFSHVDLMSPPLSVPEQDYLADMREVIDYAHRKRGIKFWLNESSNLVLDAPGHRRLPLERRDPYIEEWGPLIEGKKTGRKNPADPRDLAALLANREAIYRNVPNADGYGCIDADPGRPFPECSSSEFVNLFVENRRQLDRIHERPQEATLFLWIHHGWGSGSQQEKWHDTMREFSQKVRGPRVLMVWGVPPDHFFTEQLQIAKKLGVLEETLLFPFGTTGGDFNIGLTTINFDQIRYHLYDEVADYPELMGVMGNALTFHVELPDIYCFATAAWGSETREIKDLSVLRSLARHFFPGQAETLAHAWFLINARDSRNIFAAAKQMEDLSGNVRPERMGILGSCVFPQPSQIFTDLARMLHIHGHAEKVREEVEKSADAKQVRTAVVNYLREMLDWQKIHGYFGAYGPDKQVLFDNYQLGPDPYHKVMLDCATVKSAWEEFAGNRQDREELQKDILQELYGYGYTRWLVYSLVGQHLWDYKILGFGGILSSNKIGGKLFE
jgi:hypothetical protein